MEFCTAVTCMDGRVQEPVAAYCRERFQAKYVDTVTEAGPSLILAQQGHPETVESIVRRVEISMGEHSSSGIAVVGHHDCAGNPAPEEEQVDSIRKAVAFLHQRFGGAEVIGLWVGEDWQVREVAARAPRD